MNSKGISLHLPENNFSNNLQRMRFAVEGLQKEISGLYIHKAIKPLSQYPPAELGGRHFDNNNHNNIINKIIKKKEPVNMNKIASKTAIVPATQAVKTDDDKSKSSSSDGSTPASGTSTPSKITNINNEVIRSISALAGLDSFERLKEYRSQVLKAAKNRQIFIMFGSYHTICIALKRRGYLEKLPPSKFQNIQSFSQNDLALLASAGNEYECVLISKLLEKYPPYFIWQSKGHRDGYDHILPYRNRLRRIHEFDFTTKEGIIGCLENSHWNTVEDEAEILVPRLYRLSQQEEANSFLHDFRTTCCLSLLLYINEKISTNYKLFDDKDGTADLDIIQFAVERVMESISRKKLGDLDIPKEEEKNVDSDDWVDFVTRSKKIISKEEKFKAEGDRYKLELIKVVDIIQLAQPYWPTMHMDGYNNIWILKPGFMCRGNGIVLMKDYSKIISYAESKFRMRYIVQKYIERPLLIYKTKFDIRQYILVTINESYNIWMYRDCYLRFSSQEFSLDDFRESIHITNNAVQRKYKNGERSDELPRHNMWSLSDFKQYLTKMGHDDVWRKKIYPALKKNIVGVLLASLEGTEFIENNFELFGCDFMIDEEFNAILIEINATPDMSPSTAVTERICKQALEDVIKVVVDLPKNRRSPTGNFELIYSVPWTRIPYSSPNMSVDGNQMKIRSYEDVFSKVNRYKASRLTAGAIYLPPPPQSQYTKTASDIKYKIINDIEIIKSPPQQEEKISTTPSDNVSIEQTTIDTTAMATAMARVTAITIPSPIIEKDKVKEIEKPKKEKPKKNERKLIINKKRLKRRKSSPTTSALSLVKKSIEAMRNLTTGKTEKKSLLKPTSSIHKITPVKLTRRENEFKKKISSAKSYLPSSARELMALEAVKTKNVKDKESGGVQIMFRKPQ